MSIQSQDAWSAVKYPSKLEHSLRAYETKAWDGKTFRRQNGIDAHFSELETAIHRTWSQTDYSWHMPNTRLSTVIKALLTPPPSRAWEVRLTCRSQEFILVKFATNSDNANIWYFHTLAYGVSAPLSPLSWVEQLPAGSPHQPEVSGRSVIQGPHSRLWNGPHCPHSILHHAFLFVFSHLASYWPWNPCLRAASVDLTCNHPIPFCPVPFPGSQGKSCELIPQM